MAGPSTVARDINIPYFVQNQILRAEDLNALVRAFKQQLRQSRVFTIGAGVINGLVPSFDGTTGYIHLSGGLAISSDGYMFDMQSCTLTHYRQIALSNKAFGCGPDARSQCMDLDDPIEGVAYELEDFSNGGETDGWTKLEPEPNNLDLTGYCLILLWCERQVDRQSCFNECEEKGADRFEEILKILIPSSVYQNLIGGEENGDEVASPQVSLTQNPQVKRFGYGDTDIIDLCSICTVENFYTNYRDRCWDAVGSIAPALSEAYNNFYKLATADESVPDPFANFQTYLTNTLLGLGGPYQEPAPLDNCTDIQYLYTYLRELAVAFQELKSFAHGIIILNSSEDGAALSECLFPGHVSLGSPTGNCPPTGHILPDIYPDSQERLNQAICLFDRLKKMANGDNLNLPTLNNVKFPNIRITPSSMRFRFLRRRALPFYYHDSLKPLWDCHEPSYPVARYQDKAGNPLLCELESYDFYRIEGHLGESLTNVLEKLEECRKKLNIPFDIQCVRLGPDQKLEGEKDLVLGELDELYINTRADILCKIDELGLDDPPASTVKDILDDARHIGDLAIPELSPPADQPCPCEDIKLPEELLKDFLKAYQDLVVATASNQGEPCLHADLGPLIEELARKYHTRRIEIEQQKNFPCFAKAHPGLEHMGGVPRGGTFVLVYVYKIHANLRLQLGLSLDFSADDLVSSVTDEDIIKKAIQAPEFNAVNFSKTYLTKVVTADFCLPYLCCSDNPVIRNEIRVVRPQIIGETIFCFDDFTANPPTYNFTPEGGVLKVFVNGVEKYSESPMDLDWTFNDPDLMAEIEFINYKATVKLEYYLGSEKAVKTLDIFNTPDVDSWSAEKIGSCVETDEATGACRYGSKYRIKPSNPIPVNGLGSLTIQVGQVPYPVVPDGDPTIVHIVDGEFVHLELCVFYDQLVDGEVEVEIKVENVPCKPEPEKFIIGNVCPSWGEIPVRLCHYILEGNTWEEVEIPVMGGGGLLTLDLPDGNYPGILELKQSYPGGTFKVYQGVQGELPNIFDNSAQFPDCGDTRYFFVYDKAATSVFLTTPIGQGIPLPGNWDTAADVILNDPNSPLKIDYLIAGCPGILSFNLSLTIVGPEGPENEPLNRPILNVAPPTPEARAELNSRQDVYRESLESLAADLGSSSGFKKANIFLSTQGEVEALTKAYLDTANSLSAGQASASEEKKPAYAQVMSLITLSFLDKLASTPAETIDEQATKAIRETVGKIEASGIKPAALKRQWKAAGLRKVMDDRLINFLNDQIK